MSDSLDIAVVGAGTAGIAAAVMAARKGRQVLLLDRRSAAGGTGGFSGLTTLCGLYDDVGDFLNAGFPREFAEAIAETAPLKMGRAWVLPYRPERFRKLAETLTSTTTGLETSWATRVGEVVCENGRIVRINGRAVRAVVDASGTAEVARVLGLECLATDETTQAPAVVFALEGVQRDLSTLADAVQVQLALARSGLPPASFQPNLERGAVTVKFSGTAAQAQPTIDFLRANVRGFENCSSGRTEYVSFPRAGRMIVGQVVLTGTDVVSCRRFPDAIARCAWPIEQWNASGHARFRYLPPGGYYEIPARSLRSAAVENLFMAGKTISADADAIGSARVMGCCLATGAAAGQLAANYLDLAVK